MIACRQSPRHQNGFTLLEILLATTLLALMLTLGYSTISGAVRSTRSGEAQIERTDEVRVAQEFLRRQLAHTMLVAFEEPDDGGDRKVFEADDRGIRFVGPMPGHLSRGGLYVQWMELTDGRGGMELSFDQHALNGYEPDDPKGDDERPPVVLLDGIAEASFEYRTLDDRGELADWEPDWEDMEALPILVRLNVRFEDERRIWPLFEVPLKLAAASGGQNRFRARRPPRRLGRPGIGQ